MHHSNISPVLNKLGVLLTVRHRFFFVMLIKLDDVGQAVDRGFGKSLDKVGYAQILELPNWRVSVNSLNIGI